MEHDSDDYDPTERTALESERIIAERDGRLIDLIDTNFSANGLRYPLEQLNDVVARFLREYRYRPHSLGDPAAREAIARWYHNEGGGSVPADSIVITASASESYGLIFQALADTEDVVLLPRPGYPLFEHVAVFHRLPVTWYELRFEDEYRISVELLERAITPGCRFLVLITPNNPTGRVADGTEVDAVLDVCRRHGLTLICDEVFSPYRYADPTEASPAPGFPPAPGTPTTPGSEPPALPRPMERASDVPVLTINGLSKLRAAPELKLSWIVVTGPEDATRRITAALELTNDMYLSCAPLAQHLLPHLLADRAHEQQLRAALTERRRLLLEGMNQFDELELCLPTGGIHAVARLRPGALPDELMDDERFALALLRDTGVHLHPGYLYGVPDDQCVVLSFLKEPRLLAEGLERIGRRLRRVRR